MLVHCDRLKPFLPFISIECISSQMIFSRCFYWSWVWTSESPKILVVLFGFLLSCKSAQELLSFRYLWILVCHFRILQNGCVLEFIELLKILIWLQWISSLIETSRLIQWLIHHSWSGWYFASECKPFLFMPWVTSFFSCSSQEFSWNVGPRSHWSIEAITNRIQWAKTMCSCGVVILRRHYIILSTCTLLKNFYQNSVDTVLWQPQYSKLSSSIISRLLLLPQLRQPPLHHYLLYLFIRHFLIPLVISSLVYLKVLCLSPHIFILGRFYKQKEER